MWLFAHSMRVMAVVMLSLVMVFAAACGDDDDDQAEVADQADQPFTASPTAIAGQESDTEELTLVVENGEFDESDIELMEGRPTILLVENRDDEAYRLNIGDLVVNEGIPAGTTTRVEFTTPVVEDYEAELLPAEGDEALDTMQVRVIGPGNTGG